MSNKSDNDLEAFELEEKVKVRVRSGPHYLLWIFIIVLIVAVVVALAIGLGVGLGVGLSSSDEEERCQTAECIQLAAVVMSGIDASVDPCQDFYNFSCGNWINTVPNIDGMQSLCYTWSHGSYKHLVSCRCRVQTRLPSLLTPPPPPFSSTAKDSIMHILSFGKASAQAFQVII